MGDIDDTIAYRKAEMNGMFASHDGSEQFGVKLWSSGGTTKILAVTPEEIMDIANILIHAKGASDENNARNETTTQTTNG